MCTGLEHLELATTVIRVRVVEAEQSRSQWGVEGRAMALPITSSLAMEVAVVLTGARTPITHRQALIGGATEVVAHASIHLSGALYLNLPSVDWSISMLIDFAVVFSQVSLSSVASIMYMPDFIDWFVGLS